MYTVTKYPHGTFSWADCASTDPKAITAFYTDMMGWGQHHIPLEHDMVYTMYTQDGKDVAAISGIHPDMGEMPSSWTCYITVDDVDALMSKVTELGGSVISAPYDVFDSGRMAVVADPEGASFALWQANKHIGAQLVNTVGAMCWNELYVRDPQKVIPFYEGLLGWTITKDPDRDYYYAANNGRMNAGIETMDKDRVGLPAHWLPYFTVADINACVATARSKGGHVDDVLGMEGLGEFAIVTDPTGATLALIQMSSEPEKWLEF